MQGKRLSEIIAAGPLPTDRVLEIGTSLAEIVEVAHAEARVFGALGPDTVFVVDDGVAQVLDAAHVAMSARREDDILALGAILYGMATGVAPYGGGQTTSGPCTDPAPPRSPIELNPSMPSGLVPLLRRGVHPVAAERFPSAGEILAALREVQRAPGSLESLLPSEHISSTAPVKPPPRPELDDPDD